MAKDALLDAANEIFYSDGDDTTGPVEAKYQMPLDGTRKSYQIKPDLCFVFFSFEWVALNVWSTSALLLYSHSG